MTHFYNETNMDILGSRMERRLERNLELVSRPLEQLPNPPRTPVAHEDLLIIVLIWTLPKAPKAPTQVPLSVLHTEGKAEMGGTYAPFLESRPFEPPSRITGGHPGSRQNNSLKSWDSG